MKYPAIVFIAAAFSTAAMADQSGNATVAANGYVHVGGGSTTGGLIFPSSSPGTAFTEGAAGGEVASPKPSDSAARWASSRGTAVSGSCL